MLGYLVFFPPEVIHVFNDTEKNVMQETETMPTESKSDSEASTLKGKDALERFNQSCNSRVLCNIQTAVCDNSPLLNRSLF